MAVKPDTDANGALIFPNDGFPAPNPEIAIGWPIIDYENDHPSVARPAVALVDPAGPQDLYVAGGDPCWVIYGSRMDLYANCDRQVTYTRVGTDWGLTNGLLQYRCDGAGNVYAIGVPVEPVPPAPSPTIMVRKVDVTGATDIQTLNLVTGIPTNPPSPLTTYTFYDYTFAQVISQQSGLLVLGQVLYKHPTLSQFASYMILGVIADDLTISNVVVDMTTQTEYASLTAIPKASGAVVRGLIAGAGKLFHVATDGTIGTTINSGSGWGSSATLEASNWWVTVDEDGDEFLWVPTTDGVAKWELSSLTNVSGGWMATLAPSGYGVAKFIVSPTGHRIAVLCRKDSGTDPDLWLVYDGSSGTLLLQSDHHARDSVPEWPAADIHSTERRWQHTADNRVITSSTNWGSTEDGRAVYKLSLDSILAIRRLSGGTDSGVDYFVRGQYSNFTYGSWV